MSTSNEERKLSPTVNTQLGGARFVHTITSKELMGTVQLEMGTLNVLPIVFVPGVMGTNLKSNDGKNRPAWRVDSNVGILWNKGGLNAGKRQQLLHPARTEVDTQGDVPTDQVSGLRSTQDFIDRGWGEVGKTSYQEFLIWLEEHLNGNRHSNINAILLKITDGAPWGPQKSFVPLNASEGKSAESWSYPVYACGYNWLDSNGTSAKRLRDRIDSIIKENNRGQSVCEKVIVVTHSMGGLVTRACRQLPVKEGGPKTMESKIAGVVHGVMPSIGAAAAYTRCKAGTQDDTPSGLIDGKIDDWGGAKVIGKTGKEVTAVFAQAPGPLQLLPNNQYPKDWLQIRDSDGVLLPDQPDTSDPFKNIYKERYKWWGLVKEEWLSPLEGIPLVWDDFEKNIGKAADFHDVIQDYYHPNTWGFYGQGVASYERAIWTRTKGDTPIDKGAPGKQAITSLKHSAMHEEGTTKIGVAASDEEQYVEGYPSMPVQRDYYYMRLPVANTTQTGTGDGTVSAVSGRAPVLSAKVKQLFCIRGIAHEGCYRDSMDARNATVYAISKIAAPLPSPKPKAKS